ncbi:MAG: 4-(cytidine 5'-diphospho)-2-C-methyl-D-erythritol kinase [Actinomycetota bacterium]|jgi:4-diphosphocytidyl-2-C-methyl-D-erythritol kinase|nr:4-(cytidine 5'-diphospho)-2-C-methyl-D-erythritol kinase [Actinomycetota bacterium]
MNLPTTLTAPAKLTLSLRITGTRDDGYHLIDAEMVSLDFVDTIELVEGSGVAVIGASGLAIPADADNLVAKALAIVGIEARAIVDKSIPAGAGLGGGSSDAAAVLAWAGITDPSVAARIGADVAFCLRGGRARVSGVGEIVEALDHREQAFTLLTPPIGVSTPVVYRAWDELGGPVGNSGNDLEPAALMAVPELARWRDALEELCGRKARLAGSGGTWFVEGEVVGNVDGVSTRVVRTVPSRRSN